jgi:hypothetical protein
LVIIEVCLPERPCWRDRELVEVVPNAVQDIVDFPPLLRDDALSFQHDLRPFETSHQKLRDLIAALDDLAVCCHELAVLSLCIDLFQLGLKLLNLVCVKLSKGQ